MAKADEEKPADAAKWESYVPTGTTAHTVTAAEDWGTLAASVGLDAWSLIDLNFPGLKALNARNHQKATRQVNWYLANYVGCTEVRNRNYAFSDKIAGGRGVHKNGVIFLPPKAPVPKPPPPPTVAGCEAITIPPIDLPWAVKAVMDELGAQLPKNARCLSDGEVKLAQTVYGKSLKYEDIYISDGVGASARAVTTAIPYQSRWIVLLNVGASQYRTPLGDPATLIHELCHAWQSQHHREPWRYMVNCVKCQAAAGAATLASRATANKYARMGIDTVLGPAISNFVDDLGPADAYSYVPGKQFADYGGEQIAQHVEDFYYPPARNAPTPAQRVKMQSIVDHVKTMGAGVHDPDNERGLANIRYAHKGFPGVVWHD